MKFTMIVSYKKWSDCNKDFNALANVLEFEFRNATQKNVSVILQDMREIPNMAGYYVDVELGYTI